MKHIVLISISIGTVLCFEESSAQNIAINTTGTEAATTNMLEVTQTSTAANMVAIYAINSGATAGTGYGLYSKKIGAGTANVAGYFSATGGTANYAGIFENGNVGIGTTTPLRLLYIVGDQTNGIALFERSTNGTNSAVGALQLQGTTSADMSDGWGSYVVF